MCLGKIYDFLTMAENPAAETSLPHRTEDILVREGVNKQKKLYSLS